MPVVASAARAIHGAGLRARSPSMASGRMGPGKGLTASLFQAPRSHPPTRAALSPVPLSQASALRPLAARYGHPWPSLASAMVLGLIGPLRMPHAVRKGATPRSADRPARNRYSHVRRTPSRQSGPLPPDMRANDSAPMLLASMSATPPARPSAPIGRRPCRRDTIA